MSVAAGSSDAIRTAARVGGSGRLRQPRAQHGDVGERGGDAVPVTVTAMTTGS
jgi:hypothetical protein